METAVAYAKKDGWQETFDSALRVALNVAGTQLCVTKNCKQASVLSNNAVSAFMEAVSSLSRKELLRELLDKESEASRYLADRLHDFEGPFTSKEFTMSFAMWLDDRLPSFLSEDLKRE